MPKRRFILFCEGRKTEPTYFHAIRRTCSSTLIAVETYLGVGFPYTIATKAVEYAKQERTRRGRGRRNSFEEHDEVWAVFDRDEHPRFKEALMRCNQHGIHVAWSNPCFELWLILHEQDYNKPNHRHAIQSALKVLRPEYHQHGAKTPDCDELVGRVKDAERRADTHLRQWKIASDSFNGTYKFENRLWHYTSIAAGKRWMGIGWQASTRRSPPQRGQTAC